MSYDFCIIGAGFAGLSLADALQQANKKVIIIEKGKPGAGASGTPGALVNPATGRKGKKSWKAEQCYKAIRSNLEKIQETTPLPFFHQNGVLRPAQTPKMAEKMKAQFDNTEWLDGWCRWLDEDEIKSKHPGVNCMGGGLWLPVALTVDGDAYCQAYTTWLRQQGVTIVTKCDASLKHQFYNGTIRTKNLNIECENIIFANGYEATLSPFWNQLKLVPVKGQVALFHSKEELSFSHSVSGLGYIARLKDAHKFVHGSTYEHSFENIKTDTEGASYLNERLKRMLPELAKGAHLVSQWAGIRISTPNRKPVVGQHYDYKNLYLFTGLGSKGLLYSQFVAHHFAKHLISGTSLYKEISIDRLR